MFLTLREGLVEKIDKKHQKKHHKKSAHHHKDKKNHKKEAAKKRPSDKKMLQINSDIQMTNMQGTEIKTAVKNKAKEGAKAKTKDEDFNIDEMAEKELKGVAHGIVKEEHAEMASNHIEGDL